MTGGSLAPSKFSGDTHEDFVHLSPGSEYSPIHTHLTINLLVTPQTARDRAFEDVHHPHHCIRIALHPEVTVAYARAVQNAWMPMQSYKQEIRKASKHKNNAPHQKHKH